MRPEGPQNVFLDPPLILMQAHIEVVLGYDCCVMIHDSRLITGHSSPSQLYSINRGCMVPTFFLLRGGGDLRGFCVRAKTNAPSLSLERVIFPFCSEDKITFFQEEKKKVCCSVILSMPIARLNVGYHCCHESQPATEKSDQVCGLLEILALREVRKEERTGEKSFSSPEPPRRLSTKTRRLRGHRI